MKDFQRRTLAERSLIEVTNDIIVNCSKYVQYLNVELPFEDTDYGLYIVIKDVHSENE